VSKNTLVIGRPGRPAIPSSCGQALEPSGCSAERASPIGRCGSRPIDVLKGRKISAYYN